METLKIVHRNEEETCMTFLLENEDHTLGNALRWAWCRFRVIGSLEARLEKCSIHKICIRALWFCRGSSRWLDNHQTSNHSRCMIMKNPAVQFCGYAIPHPSERTIHLRIQMHHGLAIDALEKGFQDLRDMMEHIHATFESTISTYKEELPMQE